MLKLVVSQPGEPDQEIVIQGNTATIGRVPACDVVVDQPYISKQHLRILRGTVAIDLGSSNGTYLDGKRLTEAVIIDGRTLALSQNGLELRVEEEGEPTLPGSEAPSGVDEIELENLRSKQALLEVEVQKLKAELAEAREAGGDQGALVARLSGENESLRERLDRLKRDMEDREEDDGGSVQARLAMQRVERVQELNEKLQTDVDRLRGELAAARAEAAGEADPGTGAPAASAAELESVRAERDEARTAADRMFDELEALRATSKAQADQTEVVRKLRTELEALRASAAKAAPAPDVAASLEQSRAEARELQARVAELEGRLAEVKPPEGAQVSDLFFKLQSENAELRRKIAALEKPGEPAAAGPAGARDTRSVKELMEARLRIAALEAELSNLRVTSTASLRVPTPRKKPASAGSGVQPAAGAQAVSGSGVTPPGAVSSDVRHVFQIFVDKDIEELERPETGSAEEFIVVESVRLLRHAERVVTRVAGDLIQLFQLQTMLPDTVGSYRGIVAELLEDPDDPGSRQRLVEYLETLGRWLVASIAAHRRAAVTFATKLKDDLSERGLAKEPMPAYARVPVLAGNELWQRAQAYLVALTPDTIDERIDQLARDLAQEILGNT